MLKPHSSAAVFTASSLPTRMGVRKVPESRRAEASRMRGSVPSVKTMVRGWAFSFSMSSLNIVGFPPSSQNFRRAAPGDQNSRNIIMRMPERCKTESHGFREIFPFFAGRYAEIPPPPPGEPEGPRRGRPRRSRTFRGRTGGGVLPAGAGLPPPGQKRKNRELFVKLGLFPYLGAAEGTKPTN